MSEIDRIADQLRRAFEGEAWHGPSVREVLTGVTGGRAAARPLRGAHSIGEIVRHIAVWEDVVRRRLLGERVVHLPPEEDWPPASDASEPGWRRTLERLEAGHRGLLETVARLDDARLEEAVPGKGYSVYVMLHGVVQHDLYHAGQIALIKKAPA